MPTEIEDMGHFHSYCPDSREVRTTHGPIVGRRLIHEGEKLVDAFQGIPYAKPPIGELRFEKPVPPEPWTEVKECKTFGPRSIQKSHPLERRKLPPASEDCLTLNVFSPVWQSPDEKGFAVMVFIHGGAFLSDSCCKYGDLTLCEHVCKKDIVMVTLQYRLGYLGMLSTGDVICKGNQNLWDQTLALTWVKDNISRFGGNPENVTIMGQSAGGASVDLLSLSPHSRDLFHKLIPMAGNASCDFAINYDVVESCRIAAESFGVSWCSDSQQFLDELRKLPADTFACSMDLSGPNNPIKLGPRLDGDFLPKHPDELRKESPPKPRLYGLCRSEGLIFALNNKKATKEPHIDEVAARLFPEKDFPTDFGRLRKEYAAKVRELIVDGEKGTIPYAVCQASGDSFLGIGTQKAVLESLETGYEPVYLYRFDYFNPKAYGGLMSLVTPYKDASHCSDISYFVCEPIGLPFTFDELDMKMVDLWTTLFTNFAKYGNPNGEAASPLGAEEWLPATIDDPQRHLQISLEPKMSNNFFEGRPLWYLQQTRQFGKKENTKSSWLDRQQ